MIGILEIILPEIAILDKFKHSEKHHDLDLCQIWRPALGSQRTTHDGQANNDHRY